MPILWVAERCWYLFLDVAVLMALEFKAGDASIWAKITDNLDICTYGDTSQSQQLGRVQETVMVGHGLEIKSRGSLMDPP